MTTTKTADATATETVPADGYCREAKLNPLTWEATLCRHGNNLSHRIEEGLPESTAGF